MAGITKAHAGFESVLQFAKVRLLPAGAQRRISSILSLTKMTVDSIDVDS
jgi:hypothetical protein